MNGLQITTKRDRLITRVIMFVDKIRINNS